MKRYVHTGDSYAQIIPLTAPQYRAFVVVLAAWVYNDALPEHVISARLSRATASYWPWNLTVDARVVPALVKSRLVHERTAGVTGAWFTVADLAPEASAALAHTKGLRAEVDAIVALLVERQRASTAEANAAT